MTKTFKSSESNGYYNLWLQQSKSKSSEKIGNVENLVIWQKVSNLCLGYRPTVNQYVRRIIFLINFIPIKIYYTILIKLKD